MRATRRTRDVLTAGFLLAVISLEPILAIWALNTLFDSGIAFGFTEWLAMLALGGLVKLYILFK